MRSRYLLFFLACLLLVSLFFVFNSSAADITVGSSGADYTTIQAAINNSNAGDTIYIQAGTYKPYDTIIVNETNIIIEGENNLTTVIDASSYSFDELFYITSSGVTIKNLDIRNSEGHSSNRAVKVDADDTTIEECIFYNNQVHISVDAQDNCDILNNVFYDYDSTAVVASGSSNITIQSNTFYYVVGLATNVLQLDGHDSNIDNNDFYPNGTSTPSTGMLIACANLDDSPLGITISNNIFTGDFKRAINLNGGENYSIFNNVMEDVFVIAPFSPSIENFIYAYGACHYVDIYNNIILNVTDDYALELVACRNFDINNNSITSCSGGAIKLVNYDYNTNISYNTISNCGGEIPDALNISSTCSGTIYNNIFSDNILDTFCPSGNFAWNIPKTLGTNIIGGSYLGGNYWDEYTGIDSDKDGLGDTGYSVDNNDTDNFPLVYPIYDITINVYNESSPSTAIADHTIRVYSDDRAYEYLINQNNPTLINTSDFIGEDIYIEINASGYYSRTYYTYVEDGTNYILDAFLPPTTSNIYAITVVDDTDFYHPKYIANAEYHITRFINGSMHEIGSGHTDYSGRFYIPLIPGETYYINISATGYENSTHRYVPSSTVFEHTLHIFPQTPPSSAYDDFWENISIDITMTSAGCMQDGNITITYLDSNSSTTNTEMQLWEIHGNNNTLLNTWANTSNSFFNINGSINTTRMHYLVLFFNNTADFFLSQPIVISIPNVDSPLCGIIDPIDLDKRFSDVFGDIEIGDAVVPWSNFLSIIIPLFVLMSFGPYNTGLGIIGAGISMVMIRAFLDTLIVGGFNWVIIGSGVFIIIIGIIYMMTKGSGGDKL